MSAPPAQSAATTERHGAEDPGNHGGPAPRPHPWTPAQPQASKINRASGPPNSSLATTTDKISGQQPGHPQATPGRIARLAATAARG
ncbi:hypothetical protein JCM33774_19090 [Actinophytocola sp. KF-1]